MCAGQEFRPAASITPQIPNCWNLLRDSLRSLLTSRPTKLATHYFLYFYTMTIWKNNLLHVPEPHQDAILLTRQLQQQETDYHEGLQEYTNQE